MAKTTDFSIENKPARQVLAEHPLFFGFKTKELDRIFSMGIIEETTFREKNVVLALGSRVKRIGIVAEGKLLGRRLDYEQSHHVLAFYLPGDLIGLDGAFSYRKKSPVEVVADEDSRVLFIDAGALRAESVFRDRINDNLLMMLSEKGIHNILRMDILLGLTLRERIMIYLQNVSRLAEKDSVELNNTQTDMARYFNVNRSSLSRELNKMQNEGIIQILPKGRYRVMRWGANVSLAARSKRKNDNSGDNTDKTEL